MDADRFDSLARRLCCGLSRRDAVVFAAAALAARYRAAPARAEDRLPLGSACSTADECAPQVNCEYSERVPVFCADNGFDADGPTTCCVGTGSDCSHHADCCGVGDCVGFPTYGDGPCNYRGACYPKDAVGVVYHGYTCTSTSQCRQDDGDTVCGDSGHCCTFAGTRCTFDVDCCGPLTCRKPDPTHMLGSGICG